MSVVILLTTGMVFVAGVVVAARLCEAHVWRHDLVTARLRFPRGVTVDQVAAWLAGLPSRTRGVLDRSALLLDVMADASGVEHLLSVRANELEAVTAQLQAAMPGIRLERVDNGSTNSFFGRAVELRTTSHMLPLADERAETSGVALLASLQPLAAGERIHLQWLFTGAMVSAPRSRRTTDAGAARDAQRGRRHKLGAPMLSVCGRVGVTAGRAERRTHLLSRVLAAMSVMDTPDAQVRPSWLPSYVARQRLHRRTLPVIAWPMTLNAKELPGLFAVPVGEHDLPGVEVGTARQLPIRNLSDAATDGVLLGLSDHPATLGRPLHLATEDRLRHLHVIGPTGTGKSTLLTQMVVDDLWAGRGVVVVDPKRDLVEAILARVPEHRSDDVVVLDPTDTARPVGLNVLAQHGRSEAERELVVEHLLGVFQNLWKASWGPRSDDILRASLLTLSSARAADGSAFTLVELPELLTNKTFRTFVLNQEAVPEHVRGFWKWFQGVSPGERAQAMAPVLNKVRAFTMRTPVRLMLGQSEGIDLHRFTERHAVVLVPLSAGELGQPATELLGSLVVAATWQTVRARTRIEGAKREPVMVYLDEFQDVLRLPLDLADLLAQARGLGAGLTLAHQHLSQLSTDVRNAILATARSQVVFQVANDDARVLARGFEPSLAADDLMGLDSFHFALRPVVDGRVTRPVTGHSLPLDEGGDGDAVRAASRERFGLDRAAVEVGMRDRVSGTASTPIGRRTRSAS